MNRPELLAKNLRSSLILVSVNQFEGLAKELRVMINEKILDRLLFQGGKCIGVITKHLDAVDSLLPEDKEAFRAEIAAMPANALMAKPDLYAMTVTPLIDQLGLLLEQRLLTQVTDNAPELQPYTERLKKRISDCDTACRVLIQLSKAMAWAIQNNLDSPLPGKGWSVRKSKSGNLFQVIKPNGEDTEFIASSEALAIERAYFALHPEQNPAQLLKALGRQTIKDQFAKINRHIHEQLFREFRTAWLTFGRFYDASLNLLAAPNLTAKVGATVEHVLRDDLQIFEDIDELATLMANKEGDDVMALPALEIIDVLASIRRAEGHLAGTVKDIIECDMICAQDLKEGKLDIIKAHLSGCKATERRVDALFKEIGQCNILVALEHLRQSEYPAPPGM